MSLVAPQLQGHKNICSECYPQGERVTILEHVGAPWPKDGTWRNTLLEEHDRRVKVIYAPPGR